MWPKSAALIVAKPFPLYLAVRMLRCGSLIEINPSLQSEKMGKLCICFVAKWLFGLFMEAILLHFRIFSVLFAF